MVLAPAPVVTVTVERGADETDEVHVHAGGQGFWISQLLAELGLDVVLVATVGGEVGVLLQSLVDTHRVELHPVPVSATNGAYVHDRRSGQRVEVAEMRAGVLSRHDVDDLYGAALVEGLHADVCVLGGGPVEPPVVPADLYRRLAGDLVGAGTLVVADLSGEAMAAALEGGVTVAKIAHDEAIAGGWATSDAEGDLLEGLHRIADAGARMVVLTRADQPALALVDGESLALVPPAVEAFDHRGAGDSLTAGVSAGLAVGRPSLDALRLGVAAGALNVTRRGLGTGTREDIEGMAELVEVRPIGEDPRR